MLFSASCLLSFAFVFAYCPETKGKSLEEIERLFGQTNEARAQSQSRREASTMDRHSLTIDHFEWPVATRTAAADRLAHSQSAVLLHVGNKAAAAVPAGAGAGAEAGAAAAGEEAAPARPQSAGV